jgi:hypothetical protein
MNRNTVRLRASDSGEGLQRSRADDNSLLLLLLGHVEQPLHDRTDVSLEFLGFFRLHFASDLRCFGLQILGFGLEFGQLRIVSSFRCFVGFRIVVDKFGVVLAEGGHIRVAESRRIIRPEMRCGCNKHQERGEECFEKGTGVHIVWSCWANLSCSLMFCLRRVNRNAHRGPNGVSDLPAA